MMDTNLLKGLGIATVWGAGVGNDQLTQCAEVGESCPAAGDLQPGGANCAELSFG